MTIIELFDKTAIENMVSTLLLKPEKVYFICHDKKKVDKSLKRYIKIAKDKNIQVTMESVSTNRNDIDCIVNTLSKVIESNKDCVIDLSGGDDLFLVAAGIVYEKFGHKVQLHRFNIQNNSLTDLDKNGDPQLKEPLELSIEENIAIYGGKVASCDKTADNMTSFDENSEFAKDVLNIWNICKHNASDWNKKIGQLLFLQSIFFKDDNPLHLCFDVNVARKMLANCNKDYSPLTNLINQLGKYKLVTIFENSEKKISFTYKNGDIKKCLSKAGTVLELLISIKLYNLRDDNGNRIYNDVLTGVMIDWDGEISNNEEDVENEIDVLAMKGLVPVFISCKNGAVPKDEPYKLSTVAQRFGGEYAKKVLVTSHIPSRKDNGENIYFRTSEMKIQTLKNVDTMSNEELDDMLKNIWNNTEY